jgi:hypothetical protein
MFISVTPDHQLNRKLMAQSMKKEKRCVDVGVLSPWWEIKRSSWPARKRKSPVFPESLSVPPVETFPLDSLHRQRTIKRLPTLRQRISEVFDLFALPARFKPTED